MKVVLVVGQSGSGKSTLLDAMANYIEDITSDTNFRYKLVEE